MKTIMAPHTSVVVSPASQGIMKSERRASKPLMEKRRRERINKSLNELKSILLEALRKDSTCHSKLEKADILEMTVRYLKSIQRQRISSAMSLDPVMLNKYRAGCLGCKPEVTQHSNLHPDVKSRLMSHLGTHPYTNVIPGNQTHLLTNPNGNAPGSMPIQLASNTQVRAMGIPGFIDQANSFSKVNFMPSMQRFSAEEMQSKCTGNRISVRSTSPCSPARSSPYGKRSSSTDLSSTSPDSKKKCFTAAIKSSNIINQGLVGNFLVCPDISQLSPNSQQVPCSPDSRASPESLCSQYDDSQAFSPNSPADRSEICTSVPSLRHPFINSSIKCEPPLPTSPNSENGESVWRPW